MTKKIIKSKNETEQKSVRIATNTSDELKKLISKSDKTMPSLGKKVCPNDIISYALQKLNNDDLKKIKISKLKQTDIDKILLQIFIKKKLGNDQDDFSAFTRTSNYLPFVEEHKHEFSL